MSDAPSAPAGAPLIEARGLVKRFPGVLALDHVDFTIETGEVHALLGENGAGKSTLTRILAGDYAPDEGTLSLLGRQVTFASPREAYAAGIRLVTQERALVPTLSVAENVFLGRLPAVTPLGPVDWRALRRRTRVELARVGLEIDPAVEVGRLTPAEQQVVDIAKALSDRGRVLILDEPTAALSTQETERLFGNIRALRDSGVGILYISHRVGELSRIADRVTVLRDGRAIGTHSLAGTRREDLVREMVGREVGDIYPRQRHQPGEIVLSLEHVAAPGICDGVTLTVRAGEIVALYGLIGSGAMDIPYIAAGDIPASGAITRRSRAGLVPTDRRSEGLLPQSTTRRNIGAASLPRYSQRGLYRRGRERAAATRQIAALNLRPPQTESVVAGLSGGNQQKAVLGRWLAAGAELLLLAEPTRGVDVGARADIYAILVDLCARGTSILLASTDLDEVVGLADRVYVMAHGRIVTELAGAAITAERVLEAATR